jgi:metallo-beta-lactamase class B
MNTNFPRRFTWPEHNSECHALQMNCRAYPIASRLLLLLLLVAGISANSFAQKPEWTEPFPPHRIIGNLYYVGSKDLASYLIVTSEGNILINSSLESSVPLIKKSIEQLGFKFSDTKVLLISHAHSDHDAGSATIKELTGAKYLVMDSDVPVVEDGGKSDFAYGKDPANWYKPAKVDRVLHDGDIVKMGDAMLVARKTPGHTKGCTTWTMTINDGGHPFDVVIVGSPNVNPGYKLVNNAEYPQIASDFAHTFDVLKSLHCEIFLGAHGAYYGLAEKYSRMKQGAPAVFFDPEGYKRYVIDREEAFKAELDRQQKAQPH